MSLITDLEARRVLVSLFSTRVEIYSTSANNNTWNSVDQAWQALSAYNVDPTRSLMLIQNQPIHTWVALLAAVNALQREAIAKREAQPSVETDPKASKSVTGGNEASPASMVAAKARKAGSRAPHDHGSGLPTDHDLRKGYDAKLRDDLRKGYKQS